MFLNQVRKDEVSVTLYLTNGFQTRGIVRGFDNYVIVLESEGKQQLIYKHAVSTITPIRSLEVEGLFETSKPETEDNE